MLQLVHHLQGSLKSVWDCQARNELLAELESFSNKFGFEIVSYQHMPPIGLDFLGGPVAIYTKGYPENVIIHYVREKLYLDDPLFKVAMRTGQAYWWWDIEKFHELTGPQKRFMELLKMVNLGDGYAVPAFGPNGRNGFFGMGFGKPFEDFCPDTAFLLQLYCQTFHIRYCTITRDERAKTNLSEKEKEVMGLLIRGLSTNDIATALEVSVNTINTHLKRIYQKIEVTDRVSASLKFLAHGYIYD